MCHWTGEADHGRGGGGITKQSGRVHRRCDQPPAIDGNGQCKHRKSCSFYIGHACDTHENQCGLFVPAKSPLIGIVVVGGGGGRGRGCAGVGGGPIFKGRLQSPSGSNHRRRLQSSSEAPIFKGGSNLQALAIFKGLHSSLFGPLRIQRLDGSPLL